MSIRILSIAALIGLGAASSANADEHRIRLVDGGFFPEIIYMIPGDTATFINESEASEIVSAVDASWTTGSLPQNATFSITVTPQTVKQFAFASNIEKTGTFTFDFAPLDEIAPDGDSDGGAEPESVD